MYQHQQKLLISSNNKPDNINTPTRMPAPIGTPYQYLPRFNKRYEL